MDEPQVDPGLCHYDIAEDQDGPIVQCPQPAAEDAPPGFQACEYHLNAARKQAVRYFGSRANLN